MSYRSGWVRRVRATQESGKSTSTDSARTMITTETERAAWIYFLPVTDDDVDRTAELIAVFGRGLVRMA